ncbi:hypothetical protein GCM10011335_29040 [Aureimonas glaciei]|uniref:Uncharacterized protein n=1 Tax=Aureimonas glaciei TaxID=1776957 RepID=A0A916XZW8_9HYPH|nr:hypothetical protein GCM10011335_29040 [Aureimonas glaciei]
MDEPTPPRRRWFRSLAQMPEPEWQALTHRLMFLAGLGAGFIALAIFLGMIAVGAFLQIWQIWTVLPTA